MQVHLGYPNQQTLDPAAKFRDYVCGICRTNKNHTRSKLNKYAWASVLISVNISQSRQKNYESNNIVVHLLFQFQKILQGDSYLMGQT